MKKINPLPFFLATTKQINNISYDLYKIKQKQTNKIT